MRKKIRLAGVIAGIAIIVILALIYVRRPHDPKSASTRDSHLRRPRLPASEMMHATDSGNPPPKVDIHRAKLGPTARSAAHEIGVASGTRLVAIVDNACVAGVPNSTLLSATAVRLSSKKPIEGLKIQAYPFDLPGEATMTELQSAAANDPCLRQLIDEQTRSIRQSPPHARSPFPINRDPLSTPTPTPTPAPTPLLPLPTPTASATPSPTPAATPSPTPVAFTNDPLLEEQGHLGYLKAASAWQLFYNSGRPITANVVVAVIDSGIDFTHEDLASVAWQSPTGTVGFDFVNSTTTPTDDLGHGTHVAGLLGAMANNGKGGSGLMGQHLRLMSVKVISGQDSGTVSDLVNGIRWAVDHGAQLINLSLGGPDSSSAEEDALGYAVGHGVFVAIACGNEGGQLGNNASDYPSSYAVDVPGVLSVGSIDSSSGQISEFSNWSPSLVLISAPGAEDSSQDEGLLSTYPSNEYQRLEGTSMATPLVTGAAALAYGEILTGGGVPSPADVANTIVESADQVSNLTSYFQNGAVLNLSRFSQAVQLRYMIEGDAGTGESP